MSNMKQYRYILDKSSKKYNCPDCGKKRFVRYIDTEKQELLPSEYGICDRQDNCTYQLNPYKNGYSQMIANEEKGTDYKFEPVERITPKKVYQIPKTAFIPLEIFEETLKGYKENSFIQNLLNYVPFPFEHDMIEKVISMYYLGTICNGYRKNGVTFPFIDIKNRVRAIQVKQFNQSNHTISTDFLHSIIEKFHKSNNKEIPSWIKEYQTNDKKVSCLFGEHLLNKYKDNPIALVEAPKTAIYGSLYFGFPENTENFIWLAVYNLSSLNLSKCQVLSGRKVFLFPDLSKNNHAYKLWSNKGEELSEQIPNTQFIVSDLLEKDLQPTEEQRNKGLDLADYLIQLDWHLFQKQESEIIKPVIREKQLVSNFQKETFEEETPDLWDITELEKFFNEIDLPKTLKLQGSTINDLPNLVKNHFDIIKFNNGKKVFYSYVDRLIQIKELISNLNY